MIRTHPSHDINDFIMFMTQSLGADAVAARRRAPQERIDQLSALVGQRLPPLYLGYLAEFGEWDGPLKMADDANPTVEALIGLYEQDDRTDPTVPPNGVVIGAYGLSGERTLLYPAAGHALQASTEPKLVVSWWGDVGQTSADSFQNHLYRQAFLRGRMARGAHCSLYSNDPTLLASARAGLMNLGFEPYWFSDDHQVCFERNDGSCFYVERSDARTSLYGCCVDASRRTQLKSTLIAALKLRDSTPGDD